MPERETLETDVLIVGAGPAGLACALRLAQLSAPAGSPLSAENIVVLEKGREVGSHMLSGAVLDPSGLRELLPGFEKDRQASGIFDTPVKSDAVYFFTAGGAWKFPLTPPFLRNHGHYVVSLNRLVKWLGKKAEEAGITIFTETGGMQVLYEDPSESKAGGAPGRCVVGVRTGEKGLDRQGSPKENYQPGADIRARVTVFAEGPRGSLAKQLISDLRLDRGRNPMTYAIGLKELWEVPAGRWEAGSVTHTMGWPLSRDLYGGGFLYGIESHLVSLGLVVGLDYRDPLFDPHNAFQRWKTHPFLRRVLEGGRLVKYGAKAIPEGGYFAMPKLSTGGAVIVGDSAGFLNSQRLKGIHLAIKSGMMAADAVFDALAAGDCSAARLAAYDRAFERSWAKKELWKVRNFHQAFEPGLVLGMIHTGLQMVSGGRGLRARYPAEAGHRRMRKLDHLDGRAPEKYRAPVGAHGRAPEIVPDGKYTYDKLTDVFHSATKHEENQPAHLLIADTNICNHRCTVEFGNPCQYFCPAGVYEMVERNGRPQIHLNPSNCVHCKTCDIQDPYEIITWVCPEGGGGPNYDGC